jgi:hypothetical protein
MCLACHESFYYYCIYYVLKESNKIEDEAQITWGVSPTSLMSPATLSINVFSETAWGLTECPGTLVITPFRKLSADISKLLRQLTGTL